LYPGGLAELISGDRYGFIEGALKENQIRTGSKKDSLSHRIDNILTHKVFSLPIFFSIIFFMFFMTFSLGNYPVGWLEFLFSKAGDWMSGILPLGTIRDLIVEGMIPGIGAVAVFLPNIILLFLFISILEDTGYMARTAFIVDRIMHKAGLHGKSFIPLLIGFGCNVPAVMATRSIEDPRNRLLTMMVIPFMSCSARLPVYVLFISAYFASMRSLILFSLYLTGIVLAWLSAILFRKVFFRERSAPFVMELPPYRVPTAKAILKHMWLKTWYFIKKMGGIILLASVLIWALGYFPVGNSDKFNGENKERIENSYISELGKGIQPVFKPLGFDWKMSVSILAGLPAKEIVVSTLGVLDQDMTESDLPMLRSMSFMLFILLYFPCIGTLAMIRRESGRVVWSIFTMVYTTSVAWLVSFAVFQVGSFLA
jgi:ferrous iron transport protein B